MCQLPQLSQRHTNAIKLFIQYHVANLWFRSIEIFIFDNSKWYSLNSLVEIVLNNPKVFLDSFSEISINSSIAEILFELTFCFFQLYLIFQNFRAYLRNENQFYFSLPVNICHVLLKSNYRFVWVLQTEIFQQKTFQIHYIDFIMKSIEPMSAIVFFCIIQTTLLNYAYWWLWNQFFA